MRHVLALDEGTTGVTALVIAEDGRVVGRGYREIPQHFPQPGWVEHDAEEIFARTLESAREALATAKVVPDAIGITNQRETIVVWDRRTGKPVARAIVWQCRRTADICASLRRAGHEKRVRALTGLVLDPYFSGTKLTWLMRNVRGVGSRARRGELAFGTVDTWLTWQLTGGAVHATDPTNASRTLLYRSDKRLEWSEELLDLFGRASYVSARIDVVP